LCLRGERGGSDGEHRHGQPDWVVQALHIIDSRTLARRPRRAWEAADDIIVAFYFCSMTE
jgi:hypothetical protein